MLSVALIDDANVMGNSVGADLPENEEVTFIGELKAPRSVLFTRPGSWIVRNATNQTLTLLPPDYADAKIELPVGRLRRVTVGMETIELSAPPAPPTVLKAPDASEAAPTSADADEEKSE